MEFLTDKTHNFLLRNTDIAWIKIIPKFTSYGQPFAIKNTVYIRTAKNATLFDFLYKLQNLLNDSVSLLPCLLVDPLVNNLQSYNVTYVALMRMRWKYDN